MERPGRPFMSLAKKKAGGGPKTIGKGLPSLRVLAARGAELFLHRKKRRPLDLPTGRKGEEGTRGGGESLQQRRRFLETVTSEGKASTHVGKKERRNALPIAESSLPDVASDSHYKKKNSTLLAYRKKKKGAGSWGQEGKVSVLKSRFHFRGKEDNGTGSSKRGREGPWRSAR